MLESILPLVLVAATAVLYAKGVRTVWRDRGRTVLPAWRAACLGVGLLAVAGALVGPMDSLADDRFSMHMAQHVLLLLVASPLLAVGTPVTVLLMSLPRAARRRTAVPILRSRGARVVLSAQFAFCTFVMVLWISHYPPIYDAAVRNDALHGLEHLAYLTTGVLLWSAVAGLDAGPRRLIYPGRLLLLFLLMASTSMLGLVLTSTDRALYPYYVHAAAGSKVSPVADQHTGGVIMWTVGMVVVVLAVALVLLAWLADDERRTALQEMRAAGGDRSPFLQAHRSP